jgi:pimeloyl-ACP methyl ester carboxylesterase
MWHGTADTLVEPWLARITAGRIPHASLDLIPGAGHVLVSDHGETILRALVD